MSVKHFRMRLREFFPPKVTVLTGAGFSRAINENFPRPDSLPFPLAYEVLSSKYLESERFLKGSVLEEKPQWYKSEEHAFPIIMRQGIGGHYIPGKGWISLRDSTRINYETVYSHISSVIVGAYPNDNTLRQYQEATRDFDQYLLALFDVISYEVSSYWNSVWSLVDCFPLRTNIFSTNVDNIFEQCILQTAEGKFNDNQFDDIEHIPLCFSSDQRQAVYTLGKKEWRFYYKLHGGIDWRKCTNPKCPEKHTPFQTVPYRTIINNHYIREPYDYYCSTCGSIAEPEIMPPIVMKKYSSEVYYSNQLRLLSESINLSHYLVVIGYSFSDFDSVLRTWISSAIRTNDHLIVDVVDPNHKAITPILIAMGASEGRIREFSSPWDLTPDKYQ